MQEKGFNEEALRVAKEEERILLLQDYTFFKKAAPIPRACLHYMASPFDQLK
jgi:hypothetical protein